MSRATGSGANDVTRFLSSGAVPGSPTSNAVFSAASQADWAAKRLVWVPSEKHGFEVSRRRLREERATEFPPTSSSNHTRFKEQLVLTTGRHIPVSHYVHFISPVNNYPEACSRDSRCVRQVGRSRIRCVHLSMHVMIEQEVSIPRTMTGFRLFSAPLDSVMWLVVLCNTLKPHDCHKPHTIIFICSISPWLSRTEHYDVSSARPVRAPYESDAPSLSLPLSAALVS